MVEMLLPILIQEKVWLDKAKYADAERVYYEQLSKVHASCSRDNANPDTLTNIQITNFKESKMSKSNYRNTIKCENCLVCEKVTAIQEHNDINKLLDNVQLWDTDIQNQYKQIKMFECLICSFKTNNFNEWKCHITSISHLAEYHMIQDTYSHVCDHKKCKVLLFGSIKSLCEHKANHSDKFFNTSIPILMAEVMNRYISKEKPMYYCSHCKLLKDKPIHTKAELLYIKKKNIIEYYCKYCRVTFVCSPEMLDYHSLSVEHMTIKCLDQLFSKANVNSKKIKLSEKSIPTIENKSLPTIQIPLITNSLKLPSIILNRFESIDKQYGKCKLCSISVNWDCSNILKHLLKCKYKFDLTGQNKTTFKTFLCIVCDNVTRTSEISVHKSHISSLKHLSNCYDTTNLYSYFCKICNVYMYGHLNDIYDHQKLTHNTNLTQLPKLSIFMADIFKTMNTYPNKDEIVLYESITEPIESSSYTSLCCFSCKIQFKSVIYYEMHTITSEHIILKFLTPTNLNKSLLHGHDLTIASNLKTTKSSVISDISLSSSLVADSEQQNGQVNESANSVDVNCTAHLDCVKKSQELPVNIVGQEKSNKNLQNAVNSKQNYTNYINHKLKLLKLWKINKDRIIRRTSYYCNICDFVADEKHTWDNHNEMVHPDNINNSTVFCTTCSMFILFNNFEEHNSTTEHSNLLKCIQSFSSIRKKPILPLYNTDSQNEQNKSDKTTNALINICDVVTSTTTIPTVSSHEPNIDSKTEESNTMIFGETSNGGVELNDSVFLKTIETTAKEIYKKPILVSSQSPKNVTNLDRVEVLYEDKIYGEYVTQRLGHIENAAIKHCIKLKIDKIFCSDMNKYLMENNNC